MATRKRRDIVRTTNTAMAQIENGREHSKISRKINLRNLPGNLEYLTYFRGIHSPTLPHTYQDNYITYRSTASLMG